MGWFQIINLEGKTDPANTHDILAKENRTNRTEN